MRELTVSLIDFLKTGMIEVKNYKYEGDIGVKIQIAISFKAFLKSSKKSIYINGTTKGFVELECSRCLDLYEHLIEIPINTSIKVEKGQVDIGEEVRQLLLLEMPMKPVCSEDCFGICKTCGRHNKKNDSCDCCDGFDESIKEKWKELLNNVK
ncbi:MAG: DUF177 domain-containing protein [Endomicrobium sp.]|jgi:uncharacterized protein|nr:DUF177 domain-containing protein [Endomicrobium sp.]